ncbi:alpha/beta hydrolase [Rhodococcus sp. H29-C3]|uniref:alpha/beta fold hydrolase n=1 Tax=Rhodococcus sp. H29-C3 TaxID=3046307 RepID=UPI0024B9FE2B|nr:alpha/beta hydrolase [Rhodococcus sp. H29-C3]MDJ0362500.1 alpha/beta hydrolase [Rhodococcus sp. H29-C3]
MTVPTLELPDPIFVTVDGVRIATYELSPRRPRAQNEVVLCHGTPWSAQVWADVATRLSEGNRVFLWDMPGYGQSDKGPEVDTDLVSQMSRFAALLEHWKLDEPRVIAHDIGGAVTLGAHLLHGRNYAGLFLWDVVTLEPWGSPFFQLVADHSEVFEALPAALHVALVRAYIRGAASQPMNDEVMATLTAPWQGRNGQSAFYRQISQLRIEDTRPVAAALNRVRCPTAIGWGEQDPWIPLAHADRLAQLLPDVPPPTVIEGVGHLTPVEASAAMHHAIESWLTYLHQK